MRLVASPAMNEEVKAVVAVDALKANDAVVAQLELMALLAVPKRLPVNCKAVTVPKDVIELAVNSVTIILEPEK